MNAGFSSLTILKKHLLAEALRASTKYDVALLALGLGVAGQFEQYCNRKFARTVAATCTCSADRDHFYLDRAPVESVASVELKVDDATGWENQDSLIINTENESGRVYWAAPLWDNNGQLRFTFTGGYWWDQTEETNDSLPSGATALPAELQLAWLLQCREVWANLDKLGINIAEAKEKAFALSGVELIPAARAVLGNYRRFVSP